MSTPKFRIVHFVPDPFVGSRVPIAALIHDGNRVVVRVAPHLPGPDCLGGRANDAAVRMLLTDLTQVHSFDQLPVCVGPQAILDVPHIIPVTENPVEWVEKHAFSPSPSAGTPTNHRGATRGKLGYTFLKAHGVAKWVRKTFEPADDLKGRFAAASALGKITQYVPGAEQVLFMEPLAWRTNVAADASEICRLFGSYKHALGSVRTGPKPKYVTYLLRGGSPQERSDVKARLSGHVDLIVDVSEDLAKQSLLETIVTVGQTAEATLPS